MKMIQDIIIKPVISEASMDMMEQEITGLMIIS